MIIRLFMVVFLLSCVLCSPFASAGEHALWTLNGSDAHLTEKPTRKSWSGAGMKIDATDEGEFVVEPDGGYAIGRYVEIDPAHPYLVWRITGVQPIAEGYKGFTGPVLMIKPNKTQHLGGVSQIQTGLFMVNVSQAAGKNYPAKFVHMRMDIHGVALTFDYIKLVDKPDNLIEITSPAFANKKRLDVGDEVTFRVTLAEPAEDVQFRLYNSYTMPQITLNGEHALQAEPEDEAQRIWSRTVKVKSASGGKTKDGSYVRGGFLVKAVILGGGLKEPLWTSNPVEFHIAKDNAK